MIRTAKTQLRPIERADVQRMLQDPRRHEAVGRIGRHADARFRWLIAFAATNVGIYSADLPDEVRNPDLPDYLLPDGIDLEALRWELLAFALTDAPSPDLNIGVVGDLFSGRSDFPSLFDRDPTPAVNRLHGTIGFALTQLAKEKTLPLPTTVADYRWNEATGTLIPRTRIDQSEPTMVESLVFAAIAQLIAELAPRLRVCKNPKCVSRLFLRPPARRYCSRLCCDRHRAERYRIDHPDRVRDSKRKSYEKRVRKRHPKARVQRRPRKGR